MINFSEICIAYSSSSKTKLLLLLLIYDQKVKFRFWNVRNLTTRILMAVWFYLKLRYINHTTFHLMINNFKFILKFDSLFFLYSWFVPEDVKATFSSLSRIIWPLFSLQHTGPATNFLRLLLGCKRKMFPLHWPRVNHQNPHNHRFGSVFCTTGVY